MRHLILIVLLAVTALNAQEQGSRYLPESASGYGVMLYGEETLIFTGYGIAADLFKGKHDVFLGYFRDVYEGAELPDGKAASDYYYTNWTVWSWRSDLPGGGYFRMGPVLGAEYLVYDGYTETTGDAVKTYDSWYSLNVGLAASATLKINDRWKTNVMFYDRLEFGNERWYQDGEKTDEAYHGGCAEMVLGLMYSLSEHSALYMNAGHVTADYGQPGYQKWGLGLLMFR